MSKKNTLIDGNYLLEKFPGKGGWTYTKIPEIPPNKNTPFGWVTVSGTIDGLAIKQLKLMPMGNGQLMFSVKAAIRKKIKKQAGDTVHLLLYPDDTPIDIPKEIIDCLKEADPNLLKTFLSFSNGEQKNYLDWIYDAKTETTKTRRIVELIDRLKWGRKFGEK